MRVYKAVQQIPRQNLWKKIKEPPERLLATLPRSCFLKASFTTISSVRAACAFKACTAAYTMSQTFSTDKRPSLSAETLMLSLCVSQKTFHKSNKDGHWSNLQPEGQSHRAPAEFEHGNMQCAAVSGTNRKSWWISKHKRGVGRNVSRVATFWEQCVLNASQCDS